MFTRRKFSSSSLRDNGTSDLGHATSEMERGISAPVYRYIKLNSCVRRFSLKQLSESGPIAKFGF